ncbi:hypothetical protein C8E03_11483 [Lachnotalea glycerini]|jgi:hypothetical protein|uniref:Uncharacterized protein n=1 Tax=Lachnotalea glycerini TaxID=1763509 RepID=A0A255IMP4_9FIRM|nr:hypothetical protein [Lachnotalea glycerini]PXV86004.1 hypothetical protein C8E03_11483 [Lachnotalea glycerini]RDY30726.1 hypothetical protein CG710_013010 [Lachnotalea glycerini]
MATVIKEILKKALQVLAQYGAKALAALTTYVKENWTTVAKYIAEMGLWQAIQYILQLLGY